MSRDTLRASLLAAIIGGGYVVADHLPMPGRATYEPAAVLPYRVTMGYGIAARIERGWSDTLVSLLDWSYDIWPEDD